MTFLKCWPYENDGFASISVRYTINITEPVYDIQIQTQFWNVILYSQDKIQWERNLNCKFTELIYECSIRNELVERKIINGNRYFQIGVFEMLSLLKWGFCIFSDRYTIKFTEVLYETEIQTENWNVIIEMGTGISNWNICIVDPTKMKVFTLFQIATR